MAKKDNKSVRFYCSKYKELKTLIAGNKIRFVNHEFSTADPILIAGLDKLTSVERYDEAIKKQQFKVNAEVMEVLREEVKDELRKELRDEVIKELKAELKKEEKEVTKNEKITKK